MLTDQLNLPLTSSVKTQPVSLGEMDQYWLKVGVDMILEVFVGDREQKYGSQKIKVRLSYKIKIVFERIFIFANAWTHSEVKQKSCWAKYRLHRIIRIVDNHSDPYETTGSTHHHGRQSIVCGTYIDMQSDALAGDKRKITLFLSTTNINSQEPSQRQDNIT